MVAQQQQINLRASAVTTFKACPVKFRLGQIEGIEQAEDTDSQRMGTNWHKLHEIYRKALTCICPRDGAHDECCPVCIPNYKDAGEVKSAAFDVAVAHLNEAYAIVPLNKTAEDWAVERVILATCFAAHIWYYSEDPIETLATELHFELPLHHPKTGLPLPTEAVIRSGTIDWLTRYQGKPGFTDYKSTSKSLDADSGFWDHLRLDTQLSMYTMSLQEMQTQGMLAQYGIGDDELIDQPVYDVWHKPTIKAATLTQAETKTLIETGKYMEQEFRVVVVREIEDKAVDPETKKESVTKSAEITINEEPATVTPGKKGYAVRETPAMFGARLMQDIMARPQFYFVRRAIPRTPADIRAFRGELYSIYQSIKFSRDSGHWFHNEHNCRSRFPCQFIPICHHNVDVSGGVTPPGFKRVFTQLTANGEEL